MTEFFVIVRLQATHLTFTLTLNYRTGIHSQYYYTRGSKCFTSHIRPLYVLESKAILLDQFDNFFTCPIYLIFRETFSIVNVFFFQAHVWERLLPVQPQRDAASPLDGARESCRRPLHTHVWCLVLRGPALRNDHIREFSIPRFKQQSGECRLISLFAVIDFFGNKFVDQFNFDVLKYLKHFNWILKVT